MIFSSVIPVVRHKTCSRPSVQGRQRGVLCHNRRCPQSFVQDERGHVERNFPPCAIGRMRRQRSRVGYALRPERRQNGHGRMVLAVRGVAVRADIELPVGFVVVAQAVAAHRGAVVGQADVAFVATDVFHTVEIAQMIPDHPCVRTHRADLAQQQDEEKEHPAEFHIVRFTLNQFAVAEFFDPRRGVACGGRVVDLVPFGEQACRIVDGEFLAREGVPQVECALVERNDLGHVDSQTALHDDDVLAGHLPNLVFFANFHRSILS